MEPTEGEEMSWDRGEMKEGIGGERERRGSPVYVKRSGDQGSEPIGSGLRVLFLSR